MNASEQRKHTTALDDLAAAMEDFVTATEERIVNFEKDIRQTVSDERTHRLKLADEQRTYVDARDRDLRDRADARESTQNALREAIWAAIIGLRDRSFMGRLKWVIFGE